MAGDYKRPQYEELRNFYALPSFIRVIISWKMRWAGHVALVGEMRNSYKILVGKPVGKRPLGRPRRRWEDKIRVDINEIGWKVVDSIHVTKYSVWWRAFLNTVMKLRVL